MRRITVTRPSMPPLEEYIEEIQDIWEGRWLTNAGPKHQRLEKELAEMAGVPSVSLFSNGHQALEAAFSALPPGSEVITSPFTFTSTTLAIMRCGLVPVFCDIEPDFYTIDPEKIVPLITEKTAAIVPIHVYGNLCRWRRIQEIAQQYHLKVIYDAAHAFGVWDGEINAGGLGDLSMFSFHATKVFHTIEGGALMYHDCGLEEWFAAWRQFGMFDGEQTEICGTNAKLTEFAAAMGLCNLRHLQEQINLRREAALRYREQLEGQEGIILCAEQSGIRPNYSYLPIQIQPESFGCNRDAVVAKLEQEGICARKYFYPLTSSLPPCQGRFPVRETPIAAAISQRILCLPLYAGLTTDEVDLVCSRLLSCRSFSEE